MKLYLLRHGEAVTSDKDPSRPLSEFGIESVSRIGAFLRKGGTFGVSMIHHSTKLRARQTAECFMKAWGRTAPTQETAGLGPNDDVLPLANALVKQKDSVMVVGHLPYLNKLASLLVYGETEAESFVFLEAAMLCLSKVTHYAGKERWGKWAVEWMIHPELFS